MNTEEYQNAVGTIVNQYWDDEEEHFLMSWRQYINESDEKLDKAAFLSYLHCHTFYALIVLNYSEDKKEFDKFMHKLWEENKGNLELEQFTCQRCDLVFEEGSEAKNLAYIEGDEVYCKECKDFLDEEEDEDEDENTYCEFCKENTETYVDLCYNIVACKKCNCTK